MEIATTRKLLAAAGVGVALVAGWQVGNGEFFLPAVLAGALGLFVAVRLLAIEADALVAGVVLTGYLVGNRGFAQLHVPGIPLLPGEAALGLGLALGFWRAAATKTLPLRRDPLGGLILAWMAIAGARLFHDFRAFGFMAVRDFALVYYALFFFLGQDWASRAADRRWLERCLTVGFALVTPAAAAFYLWPDFFLRVSLAGAPLIFVKGDVAGAFMASAVFWFAARFSRHGGWGWLALMAIAAGGIIFSNSRAAVVALGLGAAALVFIGGPRLRRALLLVGAAMVLVLVVEGLWPRSPGSHSRAFRLYESVRSAMDFSGNYIPVSEDLGDKPDNNRFRMVWWQAVFDETVAENPWLGLGFGRDLADEFLRRYYADNSDEFNARSPHNFLLTVFARMGAVGSAAFLALLAAMALRTWRARRETSDPGPAIEWLVPWTVLVAACFGVILEGPMGAMVFWTTLGLAAGRIAGPADGEAAESATSDASPAQPSAVLSVAPPRV